MHRLFISLALVASVVAIAQTADVYTIAPNPDLYMKDRPADSGIEPNPDPGPMWITEDIWVRTTPDPGYRPQPFAEASPPWVPLPHENPEYRDPKYALPNYIYVRIRNRGDIASTGAERLRVYWAKASTGLSWPAQWVDYLASNCGPLKIYAAEVTKPRKNAATATPAERDAYRQAIVSIGTVPGLAFSDGLSYWHKQDPVHQLGPANRHHTPAFLPWHREYINRYEALLQEADPTVKLLYWDWTTDPENSTGGVNLFTSAFMGASGRGTGGVSIGAPFQPALGAPAITRNLSTSTTPPASSDASLVGLGLYQTFATTLENPPNHDATHGYIGGGGNMSFIGSAAEDPFFFLLHANVDRLWAQWQRGVANLSRLEPATAYDGNSANINITSAMRPWDGGGTAIVPWTVAGGYIVSKTPLHTSVVSPPIYDTAPLVIPVLQPGEAVIIQIPWYPPNPADFACFGDQQHFCLLGRIETAAAAPYGMTFPEAGDVNANTRNNNNIVWKNLSVVDNFAGAAGAAEGGAVGTASILVRNAFRERVATTLRFMDTDEIGRSFVGVGRITVDLKPALFRRWREGGGRGHGIEARGGDTGLVQIMSPNATLAGIVLGPEETFPVQVRFQLPKDYQPPRGVLPVWDFVQMGSPGKPDEIVGGIRFAIDFDRLPLIKLGDVWRYLDDGSDPGRGWTGADFNDSAWKVGRAEFGFGDEPITTIDIGLPGRRSLTTYFRRVFDVPDPQLFRSVVARLKRDDGAVVYLNGLEIHRVNMPPGEPGPMTPATRAVTGAEEEAFFPVTVDPRLLRRGRNVVAAEVHQDSSRIEDASFDLELAGNRSFGRFPPNVRIMSPPLGALWQVGRPLPVDVDATDPDGRVISLSLFAGDSLIGITRERPFVFQWRGARLGTHRLRAVAVDDEGQRGQADVVLTVVKNTPPVARLTRPADGAVFARGTAVVAAAEASDVAGRVRQVDFFVRDADVFTAASRRVGSARSAPYSVAIRGLAPGEYMLIAQAVDDRGATSPSLPVHFTVRE